jgi:hypothetical protein
MRTSARAVVDAMLARRRWLLDGATALHEAGQEAEAAVAEAAAHALEAWVTVRLGLVPRSELEADRDVRRRLIQACDEIDTPVMRGHLGWLSGYDAGLQLAGDVQPSETYP